MDRYLFLDIDGVLNHRAWHLRPKADIEADRAAWGHFYTQVDPACVARVNAIVAALGAKIVVSSTWRFHEQTPMVLTRRGLKADIVGVTPRSSAGIRGHEIQAWMDEHGVTAEQIVILDDDSDMVHLLPRLVQTANTEGLTGAEVERALGLFGLPVPA